MKLNKYLFSTFIAASALLISSCSDFLDRSPQGQFTEDDNPNALVNGKIYNVYTMMRNFNITAGTPRPCHPLSAFRRFRKGKYSERRIGRSRNVR